MTLNSVTVKPGLSLGGLEGANHFLGSIPDHRLLRRIGWGSYGVVWLARNIMGVYRAVKVVYRDSFEHERAFEREFHGVQKFEPISRSQESHMDILHVGQNDGCFYYVMELADDAGNQGKDGEPGGERFEAKIRLTRRSLARACCKSRRS